MIYKRNILRLNQWGENSLFKQYLSVWHYDRRACMPWCLLIEVSTRCNYYPLWDHQKPIRPAFKSVCQWPKDLDATARGEGEFEEEAKQSWGEDKRISRTQEALRPWHWASWPLRLVFSSCALRYIDVATPGGPSAVPAPASSAFYSSGPATAFTQKIKTSHRLQCRL